ncbi:MAG TPA: two-component sensor histidine kinase [Candidatus Anaerostipes avistercoris]|uniref:histidine kinase n=1 Tax=Candidatus Anaerostipes avistercoris TaxID=2838462 RepID=A0A9D2TA98_9FIRM|nr:ATP-binding protein [uncultured Anaerostipes sp.]HJC51434.1 two-component sensor histidine kinase [Candidatus Anaerostipes avistercoris]
MKRKIFSKMVLVSFAAVLITTVILAFIAYFQYTQQIESGIQDEAGYMATSLNLHDRQDLDAYKDITVSRITWVDTSGKVIYDSEGEESTMGNHLNRKEIQEALEEGTGEDTRISDTLNEQTYYYAVRLNDGTVLRLSRETQTMLRQVLGFLPAVSVMLLIVLALDILLSGIITNRIVEPINQIDLLHPKQNQTYSELTPLLDRIEQQNIDIQNQIEEIKEAENMRKEFSANVSHELKTPLTTISGYAELMKDGLVKPEDMERFSGTIYKEARRLISMIEDIIKLSRLDENQVELEKKDVDLYELMFQIKTDLDHKLKKEDVTFHIRGVHTKIYGVYQILYEMFFNICENAVKYNRPKGKVVVTIITMDDKPTVVVEDTGIGIPKDDVDRVFERFYRVDKSHSNQKEGSGLGLSIVKHGAKYHHASIEVESELNQGTKITVVFPKEEFK